LASKEYLISSFGLSKIVGVAWCNALEWCICNCFSTYR